jgi:hypothetical protein
MIDYSTMAKPDNRPPASEVNDLLVLLLEARFLLLQPVE